MLPLILFSQYAMCDDDRGGYRIPGKGGGGGGGGRGPI